MESQVSKELIITFLPSEESAVCVITLGEKEIGRFPVKRQEDKATISSAFSAIAKQLGVRAIIKEKASGEEILWSPVKIGALNAKNRFAVLPMEGADAGKDGALTAGCMERYHAYCAGGAAVICLEAVTLQYESRSRDRQLLFDVRDPQSRASWEAFIRSLKIQYPDTILIFQFHHAGETADPSFSRRVCVKPLPGFGGDVIDESYIEDYIRRQVETAEFLYGIGVDGVDLKLCHGYLGSQLLRPYNDRNWKYGGSWENRSRFAFETCEKIRSRIPDHHFLLGARVSMYEEMPGGQGHAGADSPYIDLRESIALIQGLEQRGCDFFGETIGNASLYWENMAPDRSCAVNVYKHASMAKRMKEHLRPETIVIGAGMSVLGDGTENGLRGIEAEKSSLPAFGSSCIRDGGMDLIGLGRQSLADPELPRKLRDGRRKEIHWCRTCNLCSELEMRQQSIGCPVYRETYRTLLQKVRKEYGKPERIITGDGE